jgi:hypothetical protein
MAYVEERNRVDGLGLSAAFMATAVRRSEGNFLFAVLLMERLRRLPPEARTPDGIPDGLRGWMVKQLAYVVERWKVAAHVRLASQARRQALQGLGLLACALEPLELNELRQLFGQQTAVQMEDILAVAADFFGEHTAGRAPAAPFRFFHSQFQDFILEEASDLQAALHMQLANACLHWQSLDGEARRYSLRYLPTHLRHASMWDALATCLIDMEYLQARISPPAGSTVFALLRDFAQVLVSLPPTHAARAALISLARAFDHQAHVLHEDSTLLVQQLYNTLVWDWDDSTPLGRAVRMAAARASHVWLKEISRSLPPPDPALLRTLRKSGDDAVVAVACAPDGRLVATAAQKGATGAVRLWDMQTGEARKPGLKGSGLRVTSVVFTPDGQEIVSGWDGMVGVLNVETMELVHELSLPEVELAQGIFARFHQQLPATSRRRQGQARAVACHPHPQVKRIAVAVGGLGTESFVLLWDVETGQQTRLPHAQRSINTVAFSPDGRWLVSGWGDGTIQLWDLTMQQTPHVWRGDGWWVKTVVFSPTRPYLASGGHNGMVYLWGLQAGTETLMLAGHRAGV